MTAPLFGPPVIAVMLGGRGGETRHPGPAARSPRILVRRLTRNPSRYPVGAARPDREGIALRRTTSWRKRSAVDRVALFMMLLVVGGALAVVMFTPGRPAGSDALST